MDYGAVELTMSKSNIRINAKQSQFRWSTRWVRSHIIKHVLKSGSTSLDELYVYYAVPWEYDRTQFDMIIAKMIKDQLITLENNLVIITK
jgi:hypothetical protein